MERFVREFMKNSKEVQNFWENQIAQALEEMAKSQNFINAMACTFDSSLNCREVFDKTLSRWAETFQIVTKKDLSLIQQQIYDQNVKFEKICTILEKLCESQKGETATVQKRGARAPLRHAK